MPLRTGNTRCLAVVFFFVCCLSDVSGEVYVSEIMADCGTRTENCEWIELNIDEADLIKIVIVDTTGQETEINISGYNLSEGLIVITKSIEGFLKIWNIDKTRIIEWKGMGLVNTGDVIKIMLENSTLDTAEYSSSAKNKSWQKIGGKWKECLPTPLLENVCEDKGEDDNGNNEENKTNQDKNEVNNTELETENIELKLVFENEISNKDNFFVTLIANNLKDKNYDIKISLEKEDSVFSEVYNEETNDWIDSYYYIQDYFRGPGDKIEEFEMRLKDEDFTGRLHIVAKMRSNNVVAEFSDIIDVFEGEGNEEKWGEIVVKAKSNREKDGKTEEKNVEITDKEEAIRLNAPKIERNINSNVVWMSTNEKIKKYALYGFAIFCFFVLMYFIVRRWKLKQY